MQHNILVVGSGGREHTLAWKLAQSSQCENLYVAPGNAGTSQIAKNVSIAATDFEKLGQFCFEREITLLIVGPEQPLVEGIRDYFQQHKNLSGVGIIGPDAAGAQLEGSKDFSKQFMQRYQIPTAASQTFTAEQLDEALAYVAQQTPPIVLKADGLAAGKGVIITDEVAVAQDTLREMLVDRKFGDASSKVVIEQFLRGIELSVFVLTDGKSYRILPEAKDYKRIGEKDTGPNTGGMGAVSPVPFADNGFLGKVETRVIQPTLAGLKKEGIDYRGFIFIGLMNVNGDPYVIEYNVRMGDPETEVVIPRLKNDLVEVMEAVAEQRLDEITLEVDPRTATTVMLVAGGYPEKYEKGDVISGLEGLKQTLVFHAGTRQNENEEVVTNGGRVLSITALGDSIPEALEKSNAAAEAITWKGKYYRKDIGLDLLA
ncbi:phosphoribosylamine--glycine ligase [Catalinimonas alkaloidigena]|uniref:Phosphoribosylamine--glycine ligase n=1 Tax=Catalinimonas alkaloidigena TaxID=1075417 RepID=A0A1G9PLW5_9BACT|nr:phosphoribosylamine--glycine ligase [Catalinimonas alkaloidigena]SDL99796.1 phosphoribosylamine--glycine ligase [Catalinimonas alkaloidigena]